MTMITRSLIKTIKISNNQVETFIKLWIILKINLMFIFIESLFIVLYIYFSCLQIQLNVDHVIHKKKEKAFYTTKLVLRNFKNF